MASEEREPITGVWGPQRCPGAEPLVGAREAKPTLKLKAFQTSADSEPLGK